MSKIKLGIQETSCQHGAKTFADTLIRLKDLKFLKFLTPFLILFFTVIGCSETPYTGPILTVDNVDRYLSSTGEDKICLQDGFDTICLKYTQVEADIQGDGAAYVHVHPASVAYIFYFEDLPILLAEKAMDTTEIVQGLVDSERVQLPPDSFTPNTGNANNINKGWTLQIYYPASFPEANRGRTPQTSGLDIRIAEGMKLRINSWEELEVENFTQINGADGTRGVQFSVDTENSEMTIHVDGLISGYTAKFYVNADDVAADQDRSIFQLELLP
ncbi:hypothetical protein J4G08_15195 [Candidatus Poribacteria bacterium]|nr:hypothetical protein [Candidatus Poribacteria bacterium]